MLISYRIHELKVINWKCKIQFSMINGNLDDANQNWFEIKSSKLKCATTDVPTTIKHVTNGNILNHLTCILLLRCPISSLLKP